MRKFHGCLAPLKNYYLPFMRTNEEKITGHFLFKTTIQVFVECLVYACPYIN